MGIHVPEQASVVSYPDQTDADCTGPKLTTVRQPTEAEGRPA
jgi:DNA-binding LacI/PurR family transcriptional regulator